MRAASASRVRSSCSRVTCSSGWWASRGSPGPKFAAGTPWAQKEATSVHRLWPGDRSSSPLPERPAAGAPTRVAPHRQHPAPRRCHRPSVSNVPASTSRTESFRRRRVTIGCVSKVSTSRWPRQGRRCWPLRHRRPPPGAARRRRSHRVRPYTFPIGHALEHRAETMDGPSRPVNGRAVWARTPRSEILSRIVPWTTAFDQAQRWASPRMAASPAKSRGARTTAREPALPRDLSPRGVEAPGEIGRWARRGRGQVQHDGQTHPSCQRRRLPNNVSPSTRASALLAGGTVSRWPASHQSLVAARARYGPRRCPRPARSPASHRP